MAKPEALRIRSRTPRPVMESSGSEEAPDDWPGSACWTTGVPCVPTGVADVVPGRSVGAGVDMTPGWVVGGLTTGWVGAVGRALPPYPGAEALFCTALPTVFCLDESVEKPLESRKTMPSTAAI